MQLPFLKESKLPRIAKPDDGKLPEEKLINGSEEDELAAKCMGELREAAKSKDPRKFRQALMALVMNAAKEADATSEG